MSSTESTVCFIRDSLSAAQTLHRIEVHTESTFLKYVVKMIRSWRSSMIKTPFFEPSRALAAICFVALASMPTGCTNNNLKSARGTYALNGTGAGTGSPGSDSPLKLVNVLRSNTNPSGLFDLIGTGNEFAAYCGSQATGTTSTTSTSTTQDLGNCRCSYDYVTSSGSSESIELPVIYLESNLLRCSYAELPSDILSVTVKVHQLSSGSSAGTTYDLYSSPFVVKFASFGGSYNTTSALAYKKVLRYQCKDSIPIMNPLDKSAGTYDPFLSESPELTYPLNFYTTNLGGAIREFIKNPVAQARNGQGFICPSIPNDPAMGFDLRVYSSLPDSNGSRRIYPPDGSSFDRSNFLLAKQKVGVFQIPLNAYIAPKTVTSAAASNAPPPLGYAAQAIRLNNGQDEEACPNAPIPTGYKWVKIWQFRAPLKSRVAFQSAQLPKVDYIACNPGTTGKLGLTTTAAADRAIVADCGPTGGITADASHPIADRIIGVGGACVRLSNGNSAAAVCSDKTGSPDGVGCTTSVMTGGQKTYASINRDFSPFAPGTDIWQLSESSAATQCSGTAYPPLDFLSLCKRPFYSSLNTAADPRTPVPFDDPSADSDTNKPTRIDLDGATNRSDFLYVVSPVNIHLKNFKASISAGGDSSAQIYTPYRFYSPNDCLSANPDDPSTPGDCVNRLSYGFEGRDATQADVSGSVDGGFSGRTFPLCALQPGS